MNHYILHSLWEEWHWLQNREVLVGIRANTKEDIKEIRSQVDLPVIGIVKRDYDDSDIYITPTMKEIEELMEVKPEIIAMDATISKRPGGKTLMSSLKK